MLVADGMADEPLAELGGKTPLEAARIPNMNWLAKNGLTGWVRTIPEGLPAGSDIANLSLLGYNPQQVYTGRGPFEALSQGVKLENGDLAFRLNFVNIKDEVMVDFSAGHITTLEARKLIKTLSQKLGDSQNRFTSGVSYRNLFITKQRLEKTQTTPPHDIMGQKISSHLPRGKGAEVLNKIMNEAGPLLKNHPVNLKRIAAGKLPANAIWLWGQGKKPQMQSFLEKFQMKGSVITAVDLLKGLAIAIGLDQINVPGATGYYDTNYSGKAEYALRSLMVKDFIFLHLEAPDEAGHNGELDQKIKAIETFDRLIVGRILEVVKKKYSNFRIVVLPDHPTPVKLRTHTAKPVPFVLFGAGIHPDKITAYNEKAAASSKILIDGYKLIDFVLEQ